MGIILSGFKRFPCDVVHSNRRRSKAKSNRTSRPVLTCGNSKRCRRTQVSETWSRLATSWIVARRAGGAVSGFRARDCGFPVAGFSNLSNRTSSLSRVMLLATGPAFVQSLPRHGCGIWSPHSAKTLSPNITLTSGCSQTANPITYILQFFFLVSDRSGCTSRTQTPV
jgi:hypothetical protein